ncbi:MAG: ACP S-malonyltransferase [Micropepsaceae bacterium]
MSRAFIFPGQGSQAVGMGKSVAEAFASAREAFDEVDDALSQNLSRLMFDGPESDLILTANAQPAIMAVSMAITRVLQTGAGLDVAKHSCLVAGHSLGEYSALGAMGALSLFDAAKLLRIRGSSMQEAVPVGEGAMSALIGLDVDVVEDVCNQAKELGVVGIANDNAPGQVVISGSKAAVEKAGEIAKENGARRVIPLTVSAPFHSPLLAPAADAMREALDAVTILPLSVPIVSNITANTTSEPGAIRDLLVAQVTGRVRWRESVASFRNFGVEQTVEIGGNRVLTGMVKRIDKELDTLSLDSPADIEAFAKTL